MRSTVSSRSGLKNLNQYIAMPVLFVIFILSIELIIFIFFSLIVEAILFSTDYQSTISSLTVKTLIKSTSLVLTVCVLSFIIKKRKSGNLSDNLHLLRNNQFKFLILVTLIYLSCLNFLIENSILLIQILFPSDSYKVWPELILSGVSFKDISYQIAIIFYLFLILPIFEELLFRKAVVQKLIIFKLGTGWIVVLTSLIYALPLSLFEMVEYYEGQAIYSALLRFSSSLILCFLYLRTQKLAYPILLRFLLNLTIYIKYLAIFSPLPSQIGEYILFFLSILVILGLLIFFFVVFDGLLSLRDSPSSLPSWMKLYSDFSFLKNSKLSTKLRSIIFILPVFPYVIIFFVDHTVLYTDLLGLTIKSGLKFIGLGGIVILCILNGIQTETKIVVQGTVLSLRPILSKYYEKTRENYREWIKRTPTVLIKHLSIIFLTFGMIIPFFLVSISVVATIEVLFAFSAEVYVRNVFGQSPFLSYNSLFTDIRSNIILIGIQESTEVSLYFLKHTNGKWFFLPDTFMSHPGDWFHGLLTVGAWIGCLIIFVLILREYRRNRKIYAGALILAFILLEILWILFVLGLGSVSAEGRPTPPSVDQTLPEFIQADFTLISFFFLPIGLICILIAAIVGLVSGAREKRKEKQLLDSVS